MKNKTLILYFIIAILLAGNVFQFWNNYSSNSIPNEEVYWSDYLSFTDAVPDEETAIKIAKAVSVSAYGEEWSDRPFRVRFYESEQVYFVSGGLPEGVPPMPGGTPEITIRKSDGKILKIYHGQ